MATSVFKCDLFKPTNMKKLIIPFCLFAFFLDLSSHLEAQRDAKDIPLSPEDKRAIVALFKARADKRYYRLQFNDGRETYGSRTITATELARIEELGAPDTKNSRLEFTESKSIIINWKDGSIIAATSPPGKTDPNVFVNLLGKQSADKLRDLLSKYFVHDVDN
jgi:hypothetical protein